jgi:hypothetical protein
MKKLLIALTLLSSSVLSGAVVEESLWIPSPDRSTFELLKSRPELTIDHITSDGFEVYGPKGLKTFLSRNKIEFQIQQLPSEKAKSIYPTPEEIEKDLKTITNKYPKTAKLFSIGKTAKGRDLWVIKISRDVNVVDARPEFKFIANMHGDEIVGRELMVKLIKELLTKDESDPQITNLLDRVQIYILPSMNPDGAAVSTRGNSKYADLNRDFPDFSTADNVDTSSGRQLETQAVMNWQKTRKFVLSANFHGGAEVVNYPWDTSAAKFEKEAEVKELSLEYASLAPYIAASTSFENGITNGYAWYEVNGGMQDWSIRYRGDLQLTVELSDTKWPEYSKIDYYWQQNRPAFLRFIERTIE